MTWSLRRSAASMWVKQHIVRSPVEPAFRQVQLVGEWVKQRRHPDFAKLHREKAAIRQALVMLLEADSACLDVGGHIGSVLSDLCRLAPRGDHAVVEADPDKAAWLARRFPEVDVVSAAVMAESGTVRFEIDLGRGGYSHVRTDDSPTSDPMTRVIDVPAVRLDDVLGDRRVDFMKLDVEGAELEALRGAPVLLARQRPRILFEAGLVPGDPADSDLPDLFRVLDDAGYLVFLVTDFVDGAGPLDLDGFIDAHRLPFQGWNYVAIPEGDALAASRGLSAGSPSGTAA